MERDTQRIIAELEAGSGDAAEKLLPVVYDELRNVAENIFRRQGPGHTLQPTALVHEVYLRLVGQKDVDWKGRSHVLAVASKAMRQVLVDHHRRRQAAKRGGAWKQMTLSAVAFNASFSEVDALTLQDALSRLQKLDERQGRVVELRFFGGLTMDEIADVLGVSKTTVEGEWRHARVWLARELSSGDG